MNKDVHMIYKFYKHLLILLVFSVIGLILHFHVGYLFSSNTPFPKGKFPERNRPTCQHCSLRPLRIQDASSQRVALVTYYGAGNVWIRKAIEQLTGVYSGVEDPSNGQSKDISTTNTQDGRFSVVQTYAISSEDYDKAIVIHRDFKSSLLEYFHSQTRDITKQNDFDYDGWLNFIGSRKAREDSHIKLPQFYSAFYSSWLGGFSGEVLIVEYEDLFFHLRRELMRIKTFLNGDVTDYEFHCAQCLVEDELRKVEYSKDPWKGVGIDYMRDIGDADDEVVKEIEENTMKLQRHSDKSQ